MRKNFTEKNGNTSAGLSTVLPWHETLHTEKKNVENSYPSKIELNFSKNLFGIEKLVFFFFISQTKEIIGLKNYFECN